MHKNNYIYNINYRDIAKNIQCKITYLAKQLVV